MPAWRERGLRIKLGETGRAKLANSTRSSAAISSAEAAGSGRAGPDAVTRPPAGAAPPPARSLPPERPLWRAAVRGLRGRRRSGRVGEARRVGAGDFGAVLTPQPGDEVLQDRRVSAAASGGGATFLSMSFGMSISILVALRSASADLSTSWATIASRLLIRRRRPSLSTVTGSFNAASNSAGRSFLRGPALAEAGVQRRLAAADPVFALLLRHDPSAGLSRRQAGAYVPGSGRFWQLWYWICLYRNDRPASLPLPCQLPRQRKKSSLPAAAKPPQAIGAMRLSAAAGNSFPAAGPQQKTALMHPVPLVEGAAPPLDTVSM